ncbi:MAG: DMT family transporter [candidate division WOR-3 bacterium]
MSKYYGEIAAIGTSFCWSFGSIFFTLASRLSGANTVNRIRLLLGMLFLLLTHWVLSGNLIPQNAMHCHWVWFGLSGIIGFAIGDTFLFQGYVLIGPRLTMLLMSLAPVFGMLLGWLALGEVLTLKDVVGIIVTILGIGIVLYAKKNSDVKIKSYLRGILCGLAAALCQSLGYFLSKKGLLCNNLQPLAGNLIRVTAGTLFIWVVALFQGKLIETIQGAKNNNAICLMLAGAFFGPFLGVWLSLVAIQHAYIGIASTLMALPPIILIPLSYWIFKERITRTNVIGTLIAILGVGLIFIK